MLVALPISHLLINTTYAYGLSGTLIKNPINMSFSLVETGVPREKPLQAELRADYFSVNVPLMEKL